MPTPPLCHPHHSLQIELLHDPQQPYPFLCQCLCLEHPLLTCLSGKLLILYVSAIIKQYLLCEAYPTSPKERGTPFLSLMPLLFFMFTPVKADCKNLSVPFLGYELFEGKDLSFQL